MEDNHDTVRTRSPASAVLRGLPRGLSRVSAPDEEQHRRLPSRFIEEGVNVGNFDIMQELFAPDFVSHSPLGDLSREEMAATLSAMRDALTGFEMATPVTFLDGNRAATIRTIKGTFDRELSSPNGVIAPNGNPVRVEMNCVIRFDEEGRIAEDWTQFDNLGFLTQLGVVPAPDQ
jgi:predicted ester cyclase